MARDFRPKEKKAKPAFDKGGAVSSPSQSGARPQPRDHGRPRFSHGNGAGPQARGNGQHKSFDNPATGANVDSQQASNATEDDEEGDEDELRGAIEAMGGEAGDFDLISGAALKSKGKRGDDQGNDASLNNELKAFMKGLNFDTSAAPVAAAPAAPVGAEPKKSKKQAEPKSEASPAKPDALVTESDTTTSDAKKSKKEKKREMAAAAQKEKEAAAARKERDAKIENIASKTSSSSSAAAAMAATSAPASSRKASGDLLLEPHPQWMDSQLEELATDGAAAASTSNVTHEQALRLLARGNELLDQDNETYHSLLNSGSAAKMQSLGGLTPSDAKYIASLLGDGGSASGTGKSGGTLSDRIAAHALLLGSSPIHNLRSLDALLTMSGKKSREESGRATRALADWFSGAGLGSRKLRYMRDQPELAVTAATAGQSRAKDQRLAFFAFEDRLKKTYFAFLQTLESQGHDPLTFVRQQAVTQVYLLLKEKSEQEQNLLRLLVNKLGDGERSVASKAMNSLLELLNVHSAMKAIVAREVADLIRRPTRSSSRSEENENTKKHHNHAKYYGILTLNQIMLTRGDVDLANSLIQLYFELFEQGLADEQSRGDKGDDDDGEQPQQQPKKKKDRWRDKKKGGGNNKGKQSSAPVDAMQELEGKMTAAILTGVRRAFPFANVEVGVFDKYLNTLFRITHSASFNIAIQALQLIQVLATSSNTSSVTLLDRFHSTLYSSMLDARLATTSKTAMYLNLCFKAMRDDVDEERRAAEVKRLLQVLGHMDAEFVCGALFLVGELFRAHPRLRGMLNDPEDDDEEVIVQPPDEEDEDEETDKAAATATATTSLPSTLAYDATKRDPRYAHAKGTCLWDLVPLLKHFHPTVRLLSRQLLQSESLATTPDLTLYSLSHFLDKFVYRNAKKSATVQKGASGMQPAVHADDGSSIRKVKGWQGSKEDEVNTERFWKMKAEKVPVDSLFFHHYFNLKEGRGGSKKGKQKSRDDVDDDDEEADEASDAESLGSDEVEAALKAEAAGDDDNGDGDDSDADSDDDEDEKEIWAAMKRTMPAEDGDADLMDDSGAEDPDEDDEDLAQYDYTDSDEDSDGEDDDDDDGKIDPADVSDADDDEAGMFDDDEDDLLPFADFDADSDDDDDSDEGAATAGTKRSREDADVDNDDDDADEKAAANKKRNAERRKEKKKRKAMPVFASADDYAHLMGDGSDGE